MRAARGTVNVSLQTGRRADGKTFTPPGDDGAAGPRAGRAARQWRDGYGVIATFRTPSMRLLKSR